MYGIVYLAKNKITGKCYVGVTTKTLEDRIFAHINKANFKKSYFQQSLKKYGKSNFEFSIIDNAASEIELFEKEKNWIKIYDTFNKGYNLTEGGGGITNMSQEIKDKISKTKTGVSNLKLKGRIFSDKTRKAISIKLGGKSVILTNKITGEKFHLLTIREGLKYNLNIKNLSLVLKGKRKSVQGFFAEYSHANTEGDTKGFVHS